MADIFDVIADGTRRDILKLLLDRSSAGENGTSVSHIVHALGVSQPTVSKHLKVLREVGLVEARRDGRQMYYRTNFEAIRPLHEWTGHLERLWRHQLTRIKERAERMSEPPQQSRP